MKRFLIIANCLALAIVAAVCTPLVMHGNHTQHVTVHFQKIAYSSTK